MSDSVLLAEDGQKCDLPFNTLVEVQGRMEEDIMMDGIDGAAVRIHPNFFHNHMEAFSVKGWQIIQESNNKIKIFIVGSSEEFSEIDIVQKISDLLIQQGVQRPEVSIERVKKLMRSSLGKTFLIKALPARQ